MSIASPSRTCTCASVTPALREQIARAIAAMNLPTSIEAPPVGAPFPEAVAATAAAIAAARGTGVVDEPLLREALTNAVEELNALCLEREVVADHIGVGDALEGGVASETLAIARAMAARALADAGFEVPVADLAIALPADAVERLKDQAVVHIFSVLGVAAEGRPRRHEPLWKAMERVARARGCDDVALACRAAGVDFVDRHGGPDAMAEHIAATPTWLASFTLLNVSAFLLGLPAREAPGEVSKEAALEALQSWPALPRHACQRRWRWR